MHLLLIHDNEPKNAKIFFLDIYNKTLTIPKYLVRYYKYLRRLFCILLVYCHELFIHDARNEQYRITAKRMLFFLTIILNGSVKRLGTNSRAASVPRSLLWTATM